MPAAAWPTAEPAWIKDWVVWRFRGSPDPKPEGIPERLPAYANDVLAWVTWRRKGRPDPRPDVTFNIPDWAYGVVKASLEAVPAAIPATNIPAWVQPWAIWRFQGADPEARPESIPANYSTRYPWVWSFLRWAAWRRKNPRPTRPSDVPEIIPPWCWDMLKTINIAVPTGPPPPPPPPPPGPIAASSWTLPNPLAFTTWGWLTDSDFRNVDPIAQKMRAAGIKTVALQIGQYPLDIPARLRAYGFRIALWGVPSSEDAAALADPVVEGYIPQIEGPYQYQSTIANLEAGVGRGLSISTVTTLAGLETFITLPDGSISTAEVERLKAAGCTHAWVECYKQDAGGSHFPISKMMWSAERKGFDHANPLIGLYWDVPVSDYFPDLAEYGKQCGAYTAETMRPEDWAAFGALGT